MKMNPDELVKGKWYHCNGYPLCRGECKGKFLGLDENGKAMFYSMLPLNEKWSITESSTCEHRFAQLNLKPATEEEQKYYDGIQLIREV